MAKIEKGQRTIADLDQDAMHLGEYLYRLYSRVDYELGLMKANGIFYDYERLISVTDEIDGIAKANLPSEYYEMFAGEREWFICSKDF